MPAAVVAGASPAWTGNGAVPVLTSALGRAMGTNKLVFTVVFALGCFFVAGCASDSPTAPTADQITLNSVVPAAGTVLKAGERVTFTAVVTGTIVSSDGGFTAMVLQDQANRSLLAPGEFPPQAMLPKG